LKQYFGCDPIIEMEATMTEQPATSFIPATFADTLPRAQTSYSPSNIRTDPLSYLPPAAADRLRQLRQRVEDTRALCPTFEQRNETANERLNAQQRLKQLQDHPQYGGFGLSDDSQSVVDARRHVERLTGEAKRLDDLYAARSAAWEAAGAALASAEAWLRTGRPGNTELEPVDTAPPKLLKGEGILDGIERLRRRGRELRADLHRLQSAPFPSSYCKRRMREEVEALARRGAPNVTSLVEHDGAIAFPTLRTTSHVFGAERTLGFGEIPDAIGLVAWTFKEALLAALDREIDGEADDKAALTHEARQQAEAEVMGDLLAVERDESALVSRAQNEGLPVEHRADISPLALLGLRLVTAPRAAASPGSSPELAFDISMPR
jgi:hypothetical protein